MASWLVAAPYMPCAMRAGPFARADPQPASNNERSPMQHTMLPVERHFLDELCSLLHVNKICFTHASVSEDVPARVVLPVCAANTLINAAIADASHRGSPVQRAGSRRPQARHRALRDDDASRGRRAACRGSRTGRCRRRRSLAGARRRRRRNES